MTDFVREIANSNGQYLILANPADDPSVWKLTVYKKFLFFKKKISIHWFNNEKQGMDYAEQILKKNS